MTVASLVPSSFFMPDVYCRSITFTLHITWNIKVFNICKGLHFLLLLWHRGAWFREAAPAAVPTAARVAVLYCLWRHLCLNIKGIFFHLFKQQKTWRLGHDSLMCTHWNGALCIVEVKELMVNNSVPKGAAGVAAMNHPINLSVKNIQNKRICLANS